MRNRFSRLLSAIRINPKRTANNLDPVMVRYNGYACVDDCYWKWVAYNQIFPS